MRRARQSDASIVLSQDRLNPKHTRIRRGFGTRSSAGLRTMRSAGLHIMAASTRHAPYLDAFGKFRENGVDIG
jgi:hypothetical protein